ncbi:MAG: nucleoside triphosphate pyrophosphohydrolase [Ktedonobacterales bacterium]
MAAGERSIIVVGLGPARWEDLTLEARDVLASASQLICRTLRHPTVEALYRLRPDLAVESFDGLYESAGSFAELYPQMVEQLLARYAELPPGESLIYAVPGHPLIAEESVRLLRLRASQLDTTVRVVAGLSFIEPVCSALELDPLEGDLQLLDATLLADVPASELMGVILPTHPLLIAQAYNRRLASGVKLALLEVYPDDWEISLVRSAGVPGMQTVTRIPLLELDRGEPIDHLTTLYVPPLPALEALRVPEGLRYIVHRLRAPEGCPWDREQTHQSLRTYVLEEAYEVVEILDEWDGTPELAEKLAEELGDLLLQVYLQAEVADQEDLFHIGDVYQAVNEKLIRRHPHVFGEVDVRDAEHVVRNWEAIKRIERADRGEDIEVESVLRGIPRSAPALYQAYELGRKAAKTGFDWVSTDGALGKVAEEAQEVASAEDPEQQRLELGDLLFALTTLSRHLKIEPEEALRAANQRFRRRFSAMEERARREGRELTDLEAAEWLAWWSQAKE